MKHFAILAASVAAIVAASPASAASYVTDTETFTGLGDTLGTPFDEITLNGVFGTANGPGTYLVNTVDFTVGVNSNDIHTSTGTFTNTATVDGSPFSYTVPYTINIGTSDTIVIGGNSFFVNGYKVTFNALTLTNGDINNTVSGDLEATIAAVPEPATWAMMLMGFGMVGVGLRRRAGKVATRVAFG